MTVIIESNQDLDLDLVRPPRVKENKTEPEPRCRSHRLNRLLVMAQTSFFLIAQSPVKPAEAQAVSLLRLPLLELLEHGVVAQGLLLPWH